MTGFLSSIGYAHWVLPVLLLIPLLGAIVIWIHGAAVEPSPGPADPLGAPIPSNEVAGGLARTPRALALLFFAIEFIVSIGLWWSFDPSSTAWQSVVDWTWIPSWGIRFTLGVDGIAVMMVLLTTFIMLLAVGGSWTSIRRHAHSYYALLLILTTGMLGVFLSLDLFLFYVMWEVMLIPMYFIIGIWGGERRIYASLKFFLYTMVGSMLMLVGIIYLGFASRNPVTGIANFNYDFVIQHALITSTAAKWLFGAFFLAFAVKVPMFPFHTWLPDAHVEAPTAGSVVLASIMLKLGTFGFLRLAVPLFPTAAMNPTIRSIILVLAVIGIVYGALVSLVQPDFKKLVAYSSVSHLGFVMLGIFALTTQSVQGALMVMINHGISTGGLFLLIGMIYERRHTRLIEAYGGIARVTPMFAALLTIVTFSSIGVPGTNGFIGEFLVLLGSFRTEPVLAAVSTIVVIFSAAYLLWAIQRSLFNALDKPENLRIPDLNFRELAVMLPLIAAIVWLGVYPAPVLRRMEGAATKFVATVQARQGAPIQNVAETQP
jgi:NADH-quinone oxidoreductase subunit M